MVWRQTPEQPPTCCGWVWMVVRVLLLWPLLLLLMAAVHVLLRVPNCQAMRVHLHRHTSSFT